MASKRLNKTLREEINNAVLEDAWKDRHEQLEARERQVAMMIYKHLLGDNYDAVQALPSNYFNMDDDIGVTVHKKNADLLNEKNGESYMRCSLVSEYRSEMLKPVFGGRYHSADNLELGKAVRMPQQYVYASYHVLASTTAAKEMLALKDAQRKLYEDLKKLAETVNAALTACNTVKQLTDNYPELSKYLPPSEIGTLPVQHGKIEELIGCTKKATCTDDEPPKKKAGKPEVINL